MSGKQNSEEVPGVCAFRFVGTFAFALPFSPFIALRATSLPLAVLSHYARSPAS